MNVLKHIKKKAGFGIYDAEYNAILEEVELLQREDHPIQTDQQTKKEEPPRQKSPSPAKKEEEDPILAKQAMEM